ncbi:MAG: rRNA-processing protein las1 [Chaenotheca gracillima]|nr:MAG: rRNA-processing protein las1 [Chaenotheca gracillima]
MAHMDPDFTMPDMRLHMDRWMEEVSRQTATPNLSRHSSGRSSTVSSAVSRTKSLGRPMRVVKPTSAGSSPLGQGTRHMTTHNQIRPPPQDENSLRRRYATMTNSSRNAMSRPRSNRPTSWHPSSRFHGALPSQGQNDLFQHRATMFAATSHPYNVPWPYENSSPPEPSWQLRSQDISPSFSTSPCPTPYEPYQTNVSEPYQLDIPQYLISDSALWPETVTQAPLDPEEGYYAPDALASELESAFMTQSIWPQPPTSMCLPDSQSSTTDAFLPIQHPDFTSDPNITQSTWRSVQKENNGKELVGMGLYDDLEQQSTSDLHLAQYRSQMLSNLCGHNAPKSIPAGKGLKLEETWSPPSEDAEGEGDTYSDEGSEPDSEGIELLQESNQVHPAPHPMIGTSFLLDESEGMFSDESMLNHSSAAANYNHKAQDVTGLGSFAWM